jgi:hypothetical protein
MLAARPRASQAAVDYMLPSPSLETRIQLYHTIPGYLPPAMACLAFRAFLLTQYELG